MLTELEEIELDEILAEEVDKPEDLQEEINIYNGSKFIWWNGVLYPEKTFHEMFKEQMEQ